ncbi:HNH endonuclease signature motif containing protein, partial [Kribbella catacumbae]|uniref:HNH endonuclease signature motif containing protein n=1 Tax=Kribbella catacumbae TaxID=460086 RepID=UPI0004765906
VLNPGQADAIVWTLEKVPPTVPDDELRVAEEQMIEAGRLLSPDGLLDFGREVLNRLDTDGPEPAEDDAHANESLSLRRADGGVKISGYLSGENAELLRTQINRLSKPRRTVDGELDPRPHPKRQADALTTLLNAAAATMPRKRTHNPSGTSGTPGTPGTSGTSGTPGTSDVAGMSGGSSGSGTSGGSGASGMSGGSGASDPFDGSGDWGDSGAADPFDDSDHWGSPVTSDAFDGSGDWSGFRASGASDGSGVSETPSASGACGTCGGSAGTGEVGGAAGGPGVPHITITIDLEDLRNATSQAVGELVYGDNLSASAVRRLACDAVVIPIVLGSDSQPLDVGMEQRYVTRAIRRALMRRDKGCVICKAPPWQCHAHHLIHWIDGGPTAIHNLALLCAAHHRAVHAGHWTITITRGVVQVTRPGWTNPGPTSPADLANLTNLTRYFGPPTTGPGGGDPHQEHPGRFFAPPSPRAKPQAGTGGLSWLTPEAVALLDPWGDSSTPSAGP